MSNKIGRFEIISEISRSEAIVVYKATDPENGQTVVLKVLKLEALGDQAKSLVESLVKEVESCKALQSPNIALLTSAEEIDNTFCAAMEYVQGNSVATTLARKEGFSIWDLLDIARQARQGLDYAHANKAFHYTLEPAKIMVTWDGTVKLLGLGISQMSAFTAQAKGQPAPVLHYMSPEQLRGDPIDARSNLFSLGAIFYEMITECKAFQGEDADQVRQQILESTPTPPHQINKKINPALSEVILKALAKDPAERYQSGQELVDELEKCKNSPAKTVGAVPPPLKTTASAAFDKKAIEKQIKEKIAATTTPPAQVVAVKAAEPAPSRAATPAHKVAAAGWGGTNSTSSSPSVATPRTPKLDPSEQFVTATAKASVDSMINEGAKMSAAPVEAEPEAPKIAVDPMMAEPKKGTPATRSFSEISELPPLKEVYVAPIAPASQSEVIEQPEIILKSQPVEKPKIQPREVARKAVSEIKKTPPKLLGYSVLGAAVVILVVIAGIAWHIHSENSWDDNTVGQTAAPVAPVRPKQPAVSVQPPVQPEPQVQAVATAPVPDADQSDVAPDSVSVRPKYNNRKKAKATAPVVVPGQLTINSTPAGAAVSLDGQTDPSWVTPLSLSGIAPGQHTIGLSRSGYASETRAIGVTSGSKSLVSVELGQLSAALSVASTPAGAAIFVDGRDTGHVTPAQISIAKPGNHSVLVKKQGYLDETTSINVQFGQTFHVSPALKALGVTDDIKYKKLFGNKSNGMGGINIKTNPKGAQIAVNHRILDKDTPVEFYLNPGTYVIDVTASGYKDLHRVIEVSRDGKVNIDENMEPQ
jgi:serine/threonine-protein kinase